MPTIKTKFTISGEKEYRQAISQINDGMKVLNSEMKLTESQYGKNAKTMEAFAAKNDVLERKILSQKDKIEVLKKALQESAEKYGESDKRTMKWQTSLNNAEAELNDLNRELDENNKMMKQSETSSINLGDAAQNLANKFGITLPNGITNSLNSLGGISPAAMAAVGAFAAVAAAIIGVEKALIGMTKESAKYADEILTLSAQTNLSTRTLQQFKYMAELVDVDVGTIRGSLTKLTNNMQQAQSGTGEASAAFETLGISVTGADGNLRDAETVFYEAIDALGKLGNDTERDALAMDLFGRSATDLNPLIKAGSEQMRAYAQEAESTGYVLDELAIEKLGAVDDAMQRLDKQTEATKNQLSVQFAPYLESALKGLKKLIEEVGKALLDTGIVDAFGMLLESVVGLIAPLDYVSGTGAHNLETAFRPIASLFASVANTLDFISSTLKVIGGVLTLNGETISAGSYGMKRALGFYASSDPNPVQRVANQQAAMDYYYRTGYKQVYENGSWHAAGTPNWRGGLTLVGENGPEMVSLPRGSSITTASETRFSGGDTFNITIDARSIREFNDIVRISQNAKRYERMGLR